jgi:hypothetical protein
LRVRVTPEERKEYEAIQNESPHDWGTETEFIRYLLKLGLKIYKTQILPIENGNISPVLIEKMIRERQISTPSGFDPMIARYANKVKKVE